MNSFELGKYAALEDIAEMIDDGADLTDLIEAIEYSLDYPLQKNASENDQDWRLGIESAMHDFLSKTAEYYGMMDVEDEEMAILDIFEKTASSFTQDMFMSADEAKGQKVHSRNDAKVDKAVSEWNDLHGQYRKRNPYDGEVGPDPRVERAARLKRQSDLKAELKAKHNKDKGALGVLKDKMSKAKNYALANKKVIGAGALGAGALGAGALLARHLYKKRQEEEESGNSRKR